MTHLLMFPTGIVQNYSIGTTSKRGAENLLNNGRHIYHKPPDYYLRKTLWDYCTPGNGNMDHIRIWETNHQRVYKMTIKRWFIKL